MGRRTTVKKRFSWVEEQPSMMTDVTLDYRINDERSVTEKDPLLDRDIYTVESLILAQDER